MKKTIGDPHKINKDLISIIKKTNIDHFYLKNKKDFRDKILKEIDQNDYVLDVGMAMRDKHKDIVADVVETLDVNDFGDYPDIICDICSNINGLENKYDKIICLAILEHVYNPFDAIRNLRSMLKNGGVMYGFVPYLYNYHAPIDLKFQDYFRFSKDSLAYLFKDFNHVQLFPYRGRISSSLHMLFGNIWKKYIEKTKLNFFLDKLISDEINYKQCSGFYFIIKK